MERQPKHPINRLIGLAFPGRHTRSSAACTRATTWPGSRCSTSPAIRPATSRTGGSPTATLICGDVFTNVDTITGIPGCTSRQCVLHAGSRPQPRVDAPARRARAGAGLLRARPAAAQPDEAAGVRRQAARGTDPGCARSWHPVGDVDRAQSWHRSNTFVHGAASRAAARRRATRATVSICLPARNEARTIGPILERAGCRYATLGVIDQIVVVDHSTDGTARDRAVVRRRGLRPGGS